MDRSFYLVVVSVLTIVFTTQTAYAQKATKQPAVKEIPTSDTPSFSLSEGISEKIYEKSSSGISSSSNGSLAINSSVRMFFPSQFELTNKYFTVPYSKNVDNLSGVVVGPQIPIASIGRAKLTSYSQIGYVYAQGIYDVESESGLDVRDEIELQWIPLLTGLEFSSPSVTRQRISVGLLSAVGMDWLTQSGKLDGMNQTFWVPRFEAGALMTFFSSEKPAAAGFDGVRLSGLLYKSFSSKQTSNGWTADIGTRYAF